MLTEDDWPIWRELRLAALADAPYAFSSPLADWQGAPAERWRSRLALPGAYNMVAVLDGVPVGMATGVPGDRADVVELISMWVSPAARGRGVGDRLMVELLRWAAERDAREVRLAVMPDNPAAIGLYRRHGFEPTGELGDPLPDGRGHELVMARQMR
ncbi:GNAT family N-acetyltransferase [Plantactinospora siamensis]|uniref:GNAT family N-acetyltransferase n=1 Tax=Plantactinospora siamensis TaxID=555372 RepID=A0ABV6NTT3_9ACTN